MATTLVLMDLVAVVDTVASALMSKYALSNYTFAVLMSLIIFAVANASVI